MPTIADIRAKYPQASALSDTELIDFTANYYGTTPDVLREYIGYKPPEAEGGFMASVKSGVGSVIKGAGQAAADFIPGVDQGNALQQYGQGVIDANPTAVHSLSDIGDKPWTAVKEAAGNAGGSIGQMLGARAIGTGITMASPLAGPAAPAVALLGQAISWFGPAAVAALPSYGGIRDKQILNDPTNNEDWKAKAVAALGAATVGAIETKFGPQQWALGAMTKEGRAALAEKFAETTLAKGIGYGALKGAAVEGAEELVQNPIEQLASFDDPTTKANLQDTAFSGAMGALGGGALGGGFGAAFRAKPTAQSKAPVADPLLIGNTPDPMIGFADGTVARKSEVEAYIASLPEAQRPAARAKMMGMAPQKTPADVLAAGSVDEAIATASAAISTPPADLLGAQAQNANQGFLGAARETQAQNQADAADLADLTQSETRNLQVMRAQAQQDQTKQTQLEQIRAQSIEDLGRLPDQQVAVATAATDETPTAMQLAMQKALTVRASPVESIAQPDAAQRRLTPPDAASVEPRLVERQPGMVAMPQKLAQQRADANPELEAVRIQNQSGKFAYTTIPRTADVSNAVPVQPVPGGTDQRGAPEPAPSVAPGVGLGSDTGTAVVAGRGGNKPGVDAVLPANQPPVVDQRLIPVSKREASRENAEQAPQEARAGAETAAVPATGNATLPTVTQEQADGFTPDQTQQTTPQRQETPAADQRLTPVSKRASPARPLRRAAYDKNPLMTFLATHGLFHDKSKTGSQKAEFSPDKGILVSGYGPVFRKTGKHVDELVDLAIQDGYLPKDGTAEQLYDMVRRAVAGEKIQPMYAEGVAEAEAERQMEARRALEEDQDSAQNEEVAPEDDAQGVEAVAVLSDAELFALDDGIPMDASSNASTEDFLRAMGATEQEIQDAIAEETRVTQARDQGRAGVEETAASQAPGSDARGNEEARAGATELTAPTRADILAQQERTDSAAQSKEKADRAADKKAREEEDRKRIAKASEAAADTFELGGDAMANLTGQKDIFSQPEPVAAESKPDTLSDIDPASLRKLMKRVKVDHQVLDDVSGEGGYVTQEVTAAESLKSIDEDLTNYNALLKCMKG